MTKSTPNPAKEDQDVDAPFAKPAPRQSGKPDQLKDKKSEAESDEEALLDAGLEESFPASDPVSAKHIT